MNARVLVPIKAFAAAKGRLRGTLDPADRADLARTLAAGVVAAAAPLPVLVVCDDDDVAAFARALGAEVLRQRQPGLNAAVAEGVDHLASAGVNRVVIAHADLPRPSGLPALATGSGVTVVPDRDDDGTNVLVVPTGAGFRFAYGRGSFAAHLAEAERVGLPVTVVRDDALAWDVDTADDLAELSSPKRSFGSE